MTVVTRAPGKLFIAGEYAVVEPGHPSILIAVDRFLTIRATPSTGYGKIFSDEYGKLPVEWRRDPDSGFVVVDNHPYDYVSSAITVVERLRAERGFEPRYFDLHIESELDDTNGQKYGLGSSAAVVVATVDAVGQLYNLGLTRLERFKLALLATIAISPRSSGGDIASSTYGGWITYRSPDRAALREYAETHSITDSLDAPGWEPFSLTELNPPRNLDVRVGWTGSPSSTDALVGSVKKASPTDSPHYTTFLEVSDQIVADLADSLNSGNVTEAQRLLRDARTNLLHLESTSGITIETAKLTELCRIAEECGGAAKPSGAGGGDCGIVLATDRTDHDQMVTSWQEAGIKPLDLQVYTPEVDHGR